MFADLKAPRFNKRKYRQNIVSEALHKEWMRSTGYDKSFDEFKRIWNAIAVKITDKVLTERDGVRLGNGIGDLYIGLVQKTRNRGIDYKLSRELNKIVYYENWNTSGSVGKIIYGTTNRPYMYRLSKFWGFTAHTVFKAKCVQALRNNPELYKNTLEGKYQNKNVNTNKGRVNI